MQLINSDCLLAMKSMPDNSIDSIVTDPPYGLSFMAKKWDYDVPTVAIWQECLRVLKPGGHLLAFAGTRTQHRMAVRIEDAGFEIRDMIAWVYGSGFPKSLDVSKAIDKNAGFWRGKAGEVTSENGAMSGGNYERTQKGDPVTAAAAWEGWGTALKPALEPITLARKPLIGTVAENVLTHGTGALNIDGCRVESGADYHELTVTQGGDHFSIGSEGKTRGTTFQPSSGRWPANLIHDGSEEVTELFPRSKSVGSKSVGSKWIEGYDTTPNGIYGKYSNRSSVGYIDHGSAARFFYCAKANKKDRNEGCDGLPFGDAPGSKRSEPADGRESALGAKRANFHPTVKPTELMRYLCKLVTRPGGTVLDPFMGSGSTGKAAKLEGFGFIGIELDPEYCKIAEARINGVPTNDNQ